MEDEEYQEEIARIQNGQDEGAAQILANMRPSDDRQKLATVGEKSENALTTHEKHSNQQP